MFLKPLFDETADNGNLEKSAAMLLGLAKKGAPKELLAALLDLAVNNKLHSNHRRYLIAPIVQHESGWRDTTPDWLFQAAVYDRLKTILEEHKKGYVGWQVGPSELTAVMYPATMEAPLRHEPAQVYLWASVQANAFHRGKSTKHYWEVIGGHPIKDEDVLKASGRYHYFYRQICTEIRLKTVKAAVDKERDLKKERKNSATSDSQSPNIQLNLF